MFNSDSLLKASGILFQRNGNANFFTIFSTLLGTEVSIHMYQMELHSTDCRVILFPLNDNSLLLLKFTHFYKLEIVFPEVFLSVFLSASVVPTYTPYCFWKSLVHFRPAGSNERTRVRMLRCEVKTLGNFFTLHCSSSLGCINKYLAIDKWWICVRAAFEH